MLHRKKLHIIFQDQDLAVVEKPVGMESQEARGTAPDMVSMLRREWADLSTLSGGKAGGQDRAGGGIPYVGVIHRLDRQVGGIMVYAMNRKSAGALSRAVQDGKVKKTYLAVLCGKLVDKCGRLEDNLWKDGKNHIAVAVDKSVQKGAKRAVLKYRVLGERRSRDGLLTLVEIDLETGRQHQIRVQFSSRGCPVWGDAKYGTAVYGKEPALASARLRFIHPRTGKPMDFCLCPKGGAFDLFAPELAGWMDDEKADNAEKENVKRAEVQV